MIGLTLINPNTRKTVINGDVPFLYLYASVPAEYLVASGTNNSISVVGYGRNDNVRPATSVVTAYRDYVWPGPSNMVVTLSARKSMGIHYCFDPIRTGANSMRIYYYAVGYGITSDSDFSWIDDWLQFDLYTQTREIADFSASGLQLYDSNNKMSFSSNFTRILDVRGQFNATRENVTAYGTQRYARESDRPPWGSYYDLGYSVKDFSLMPYSSERHFFLAVIASAYYYSFELLYGYGVVNDTWYQIQALTTKDSVKRTLNNTSVYAMNAWCSRGCNTELGKIWQVNYGYETSITIPYGAFAIGGTNYCDIVVNVQTTSGVKTYTSNRGTQITIYPIVSGSVCTSYVNMDSGYIGGILQLCKCNFYDNNGNPTTYENATSIKSYEEERIIFSPNSSKQVTFVIPSNQTKGYTIRMLANPSNTGNAYYYKIQYSSKYYNLAIGIQYTYNNTTTNTRYNITEDLDNPYYKYDSANGYVPNGHYFVIVDSSGNERWTNGISTLCQLASNDGLPVYTYNESSNTYIPYGDSNVNNTIASKNDINVIDFTKYVTSITEVTNLINVSFYIPEGVYGLFVVTYDTMSKTYNIGEGYSNIKIPRGANYTFAVGFNINSYYRNIGIIVNNVPTNSNSTTGTLNSDTSISYPPLIWKNKNAIYEVNVTKDNKYSARVLGVYSIWQGDTYIGQDIRFEHISSFDTERKVTMIPFTETSNDIEYDYIPCGGLAFQIYIESGYNGYSDYVNDLIERGYSVYDHSGSPIGNKTIMDTIIYTWYDNKSFADIADINNCLVRNSTRTLRSLFYLPEHTYMEIFMYNSNNADTQKCYKKKIIGSATDNDYLDFYENDTVQLNLYAENGYTLSSNGILYVACAYNKPSQWYALGSSTATLNVSFNGSIITINGISYGFAFSANTPTIN